VAHAQCDTSFTLVNRCGATVQEFYSGSSAQSAWGADQLGTNVLVNGQGADLMRVDICVTSEIVATRSGIEAR